MSAKITRRRFLGAAAAGGAWIVMGGTLGCGPSPRARAVAAPARGEQPWAFRSRPEFRPPAVEVRTRARGTAPGYVFVAPKKEPGAGGPTQDAPLIVDNGGEPVWFHPLHGDAEKDAFNFGVQTYRGEALERRNGRRCLAGARRRRPRRAGARGLGPSQGLRDRPNHPHR